MTVLWDAKACAAVEALRAGVVNRYLAENLTFGRESEIHHIESAVRKSPDGSCQVIIGGYGIGKSHLCEVLALRLEMAGYAVARLEMGASHGRAENPQAVLSNIAERISVSYAGRRFWGSEIIWLLKAIVRPSNSTHGDGSDLVAAIHKRLPGSERLMERYVAIREALEQRFAEYYWIRRPRLFNPVRSEMTASNLCVAEVNEAAYKLSAAGFQGIVILFDEAERSNSAAVNDNEYRATS